MPNRKKLTHIFVLNYLLTVGIWFMALSLFVTILIIQTYYQFRFNANIVEENTSILTENYKDIDRSKLLKANGCIEIVKNNKVVETIGDDKDNIKEYNIEDLINGENRNSNYKVKAYSEGIGSNETVYVVKIPQDNKSLVKEIKQILHNAIISLLVSVVFIIICMCIMAYFSIKIVKSPFKKIQNAITKMSNGDYGVRLDFNSYNELEGVKSAFNYMADKLQQSEKDRKLAEEARGVAEESKKKVIRNISHDIKTPITSIMGYSKLLMEEKVENEEEYKVYLGYIYNKTARLNYLVDNLFSFSKLDTVNYELNKSSQDIVDFLMELVALYYGDMEQKNFELVMDVPENAVYADFDAKEMERALGNLIVNSIKYNPDNTKLTISLVEEAERVMIAIEDNGVGMDEETVAGVFGEFVRGDKARKSDGGSGLGLSITKRIIELHDGEIKLISKVEEGTRFEIILPLNKKS